MGEARTNPELLEDQVWRPTADEDEGVAVGAEHGHQFREADTGSGRDVVFVVASGARLGHAA